MKILGNRNNLLRHSFLNINLLHRWYHFLLNSYFWLFLISWSFNFFCIFEFILLIFFSFLWYPHWWLDIWRFNQNWLHLIVWVVYFFVWFLWFMNRCLRYFGQLLNALLIKFISWNLESVKNNFDFLILQRYFYSTFFENMFIFLYGLYIVLQMKFQLNIFSFKTNVWIEEVKLADSFLIWKIYSTVCIGNKGLWFIKLEVFIIH